MKQKRDIVWYFNKRLKMSLLTALNYYLRLFWAKLALELEFKLPVRLN